MPRRITIQENHGCYSLICHSDEKQITDETVNELNIHEVTLQAKRFLKFGDRLKTLPYKKRGSTQPGGNSKTDCGGDQGIQPKEDVKSGEVQKEDKNRSEPDQRSQGGKAKEKGLISRIISNAFGPFVS